MPERTFLDNKEVLHELKEQKATFKLIKVYTNNDDSEEEFSPQTYNSKDKTIRMNDKSHTQLFYNTTNKLSLKNCTPSYCRNVYRPNNKIDNLYWYSEALKSVSSSSTLWTIDQAKIKKSKIFGKIKRPRVFSINNPELESRSIFEYGSSEHEPKGYSGEVTTPFDQSSIQRYRWVRYKDGSRWVFIARNDPNTPLAELNKTESENEFDIVFLESSPRGWKLGDMVTRNSNSIDSDQSAQSAQFTGRYPSVFSNPSTYRSSTTSGFLSNRESSFSDVSNIRNSEGGGYDKNSKLFSTYSESKFTPLSTYSESKLTNLTNTNSEIDSERLWQEYVLASTVTIQDEVNSHKKRLWGKKRN